MRVVQEPVGNNPASMGRLLVTEELMDAEPMASTLATGSLKVGNPGEADGILLKRKL